MEILDKDLAFLAKCRNEELRVLCDILTYDRNGMLRYAEQLTGSDAYLLHFPMEMSQMSGEIADELCKFGSNSVVTYFRKVVPGSYETVVRRVSLSPNLTTWPGRRPGRRSGWLTSRPTRLSFRTVRLSNCR